MGLRQHPGDVRASAELSDFSANLRAPILIFGGRGHQLINEAPDAPVRASLGLGSSLTAPPEGRR